MVFSDSFAGRNCDVCCQLRAFQIGVLVIHADLQEGILPRGVTAAVGLCIRAQRCY